MPSKQFYRKLAAEIRAEPDVLTAWKIYQYSFSNLQLNETQQRDCAEFLQCKRGIWVYCRGAGKTEKSTHLAVFLSLRGEQVLWLAGAWTQLLTAQRYWSQNPYIEPFNPSNHRSNCMTVFNEQLDFYFLSESNVRGKRASAVFYDEVIEMKDDEIDVSFGCFTHTSNPYMMFFSTPRKGSYFEELCDEHNYSNITYLDCGWMNAELIEGLKDVMPLWKWKQEFMAEFIMPEGAVFQYNLTEVESFPGKYEEIIQGVDPNASVGNIGVRVGLNHKTKQCWILEQQVFQYKRDDSLLQGWANIYPTVIEDGGWNTTYAPKLHGAKLQVMTKQYKEKKIEDMLGYTIFINKDKTPMVYKDLMNATWDTDKSGDPKVETNDLHSLAALIHAFRKEQKTIFGWL